MTAPEARLSKLVRSMTDLAAAIATYGISAASSSRRSRRWYRARGSALPFAENSSDSQPFLDSITLGALDF